MLNVKKEGIVLEPTDYHFEDHGVLNPAAILVDGKIHMFYRATNKANYSTICHCTFKTVTEIEHRDDTPILIPLEKYETHGIEDPRIVKIDDLYFLTYTAYDGKNAMGALAISKDLITFERMGILTPQMTYKEYQMSVESCDGLNIKYLRFAKLFHKRTGAESILNMLLWDKDIVFFPKKINGNFALLHRIYPDIQVAYFKELKDLNFQYWKEYLFNIQKNIVLSSKMPFESSYIGAGCPPIETNEGWLLIYHGVEDTLDGYVYSAGAALVELEDPTKEIGRLKRPLFSPDLEWEKNGVTKNVVFPTAAIVLNGILQIYYGAADKRIGTLSVNLQELINEIKNPAL
jgi:beta-1,2-mannobiose phosphorylase / 1,2-beta-oligomannan phosphorylase